MTTKRKKLKVRKFDDLSSSRSGDTEENFCGGKGPPRLIRVNSLGKGLRNLWATDMARTKFIVVEINFTSHSARITLEKSIDVD